MNEKEFVKVVIERANDMLTDKKINTIYLNHKSKDEADEWLVGVAFATLFIPINERETSTNKLNQ